MADDWDDDGPRLLENLAQARVTQDAFDRKPITLAAIKRWHKAMMKGLRIPAAEVLGRKPEELLGVFRGSPGLRGVGAQVGPYVGTHSTRVNAETAAFIEKLGQLIQALDRAIPADELAAMSNDDAQAVVETVAWAHGEWVRIHPFVNGNGRSARLLGNALLVRYGLPPVLRLRPRPEGSYAQAALRGMHGDARAMAAFLRTALRTTTQGG